MNYKPTLTSVKFTLDLMITHAILKNDLYLMRFFKREKRFL